MGILIPVTPVPSPPSPPLREGWNRSHETDAQGKVRVCLCDLQVYAPSAAILSSSRRKGRYAGCTYGPPRVLLLSVPESGVSESNA